MKLSLLILFSSSLIFINCTNSSKSEIVQAIIPTEDKIILDIETEGYKILIEEIDKVRPSIITNSHSTQPFLSIKADYISLRELMGLIKGIDPDSIEIANNTLKHKYYKVFINQNWVDENREEKIKNDIIKALGIEMEENPYSSDTTFVSLDDPSKFLNFSNLESKAKIINKSTIIGNYINFENTDLDNLIEVLNQQFKQELILSSKESQRINYKMKKGDWNATKSQLESDLGLVFMTKNHSSRKYIIKEYSLSQL